MNPIKQRRILIFLFIFNMIVWVICSFIFIVLWEIHGGVSTPTTNQVSILEYQLLADWLREMVFHVIPGVASGYFIFAMIILDLIVKTKPAKGGPP